MLDLVIRGEDHIVDGTGATAVRADVGVKDGRVVADRRREELRGHDHRRGRRHRRPGLHRRAYPLRRPGVLGSRSHTVVPHGLTTVFAGNCGFSVAPLTDQAAPLPHAMLSRVEGMPLASLQTAVPWDWESTEDYLQRLTGNVG